MQIRKACLSDVTQICEVVRASINELCFEDHRGNPAILAPWLANKTDEDVARWLHNPENIILVAEEDGKVLAAGCVTSAGEIRLNYVSPRARFRGVSTALLREMEETARRAGNTRCVLESTRTAHRFYRERGYCDTGQPGQKHGLETFPMAKAIV